MTGTAKDETVAECLRALAASGVDFDVVDHWDDDLMAIGIASPEDHGWLVYVSTHDQPRGRCYAELEVPEPDDPAGHRAVLSFASISYEELAPVVRMHLTRWSRSGRDVSGGPMRAALIVDPDSIRLGNLGPATGDVWLDLEGTGFPMTGWNDFVVVVVGWWAMAATRLLRCETNEESVPFMEGPHDVRVSRDAAGGVRIEPLTEKKRVATASLSEAEWLAFVDGLVDASASLLSACDALAHSTRDVQGLRRELALLREARRSLS